MTITLNRKEVQAQKIPETRLSVDFPEQGGIISYPRYTFRLSVPEGAKNVEIAIDQGDWRPCRQSSGYWWHDWSDYANGEHEIIARMETREGRRINSEPKEFFVQLPAKSARD